MSIDHISRRGFLKSVGVATGAFALGMTLPGLALAEDDSAFRYNLFVVIDKDGTVTLTAMSPDIGQGARTAMPSIVADELEADWDRVKLVQAGPDKRLGSQSVGGSSAIRDNYANLRLMGATARTMLERAAARIWGVYVEECQAQNHNVVHQPTGRTLGYGELAEVASKLPVPSGAEVKLKTEDQFRYIGKSLKAVDQAAILTGSAEYSIDLKIPGMKIAMMVRPPVVGGSVKSFDASEALKVKGVEKVFTLGDGTLPIGFGTLGGIVVVASNTWAAKKGCDALMVEWNAGPNGGYDTDVARKEMEDRVADEGKVERNRGDFKQAFQDAEHIVDAAYYVPHHAHASMEPPVALAKWDDGKLEIWTPTQGPQRAEAALMQYLGIKREDITLHVPLTGGGFGRKGKPDFSIEAALISREMGGTPIKLVWTREDDIRHCYMHSSAAQRLQASLDKKGRVTGWRHHTTFPSISETFSTEVTSPGSSEVGMGASNVPFDIPNIRVESSYSKAQVRIGWSRAVHNINHAFAIGSFVDELAHAAKKDSAKFLLDMIGKPNIVNLADEGVTAYGYERLLPQHPIDTGRLAAVVKAVMKQAKWGRKMPKGRALGIAVHRSFLTYVASVVEVDMTDGGLKIPNVWYAVDCGQVVNVDRVKAQFEGGAMYALSHALTGKITAKDGAVEQSNFHDFEVLRMGMAPAVHVHLMDSDRAPTGVGEPPVPSVAPALTNAIFAASGQRIRELPVMDQLVQS